MRHERGSGLAELVARALARHRARRLALRQGERRAAVLVPLLGPEGDPALLVERRADTLASHAGQYAFPGGTVEAADRDPEAAALREAGEEVGLEADRVETLGRLSDVRTPTGFLITPVVAVVHGAYEPRLQEEEVADIVLVPLAAVLAGGAFRPVRRRTRHVLIHSTALVWRGHEIWGATARMLLELRRLLLRSGGTHLLR